MKVKFSIDYNGKLLGTHDGQDTFELDIEVGNLMGLDGEGERLKLELICLEYVKQKINVRRDEVEEGL